MPPFAESDRRQPFDMQAAQRGVFDALIEAAEVFGGGQIALI